MVVFLGFVPVLIGYGNGVRTPPVFVFCGVVVAGLATMARRLPNPGGFYPFITAGLGKTVGLRAGFAAITSYYVVLLSGYALGGIALKALVADVFDEPSVAWWVWSLLFSPSSQ